MNAVPQRRSTLPGFGLTMGLTLTWLSVIILIPLAGLFLKSFAKVELFTIDDVFGGWTKAQKEHFAEGGVFDQIYKN